jgi:predicted porin
VLSGGQTITREDDRTRARLGLEYKSGDNTKLFARYDYYDNDSNIDEQIYERNLYSIGLKHTF